MVNEKKPATPAKMWRYLSDTRDFATTKIYLIAMMSAGVGSLGTRYASDSVVAIVILSVVSAVLGMWAARSIVNRCVRDARSYGRWEVLYDMEHRLQQQLAESEVKIANARVALAEAEVKGAIGREEE